MTKAVLGDNKKFNLRILDNKRTPVGTGAAAKKAIKHDVDFVIGTFSSSEAVVAAKKLEEAGIPFLAPTASSPKVAVDRPHIFSLASTDHHFTRLLADFTTSKFKPNSIFIVKNLSRETSLSGTRTFKTSLRETAPKTKIIEREIVTGHEDYASLAKDIKNKTPDLVFLPLHSYEAGKLYLELKGQNVKTTLLGTDSIGGRKDFLKLIGKTSPKINFVFFKQWNGKIEGRYAPNFQLLAKKHCKRFGKSMVLAVAYDVSMIAKSVARKVQKNKNRTDILKNIDFDGITGKHSFDADGYTRKPLQLYRIKDNQAKFWKTYSGN